VTGAGLRCDLMMPCEHVVALCEPHELLRLHELDVALASDFAEVGDRPGAISLRVGCADVFFENACARPSGCMEARAFFCGWVSDALRKCLSEVDWLGDSTHPLSSPWDDMEACKFEDEARTSYTKLVARPVLTPLSCLRRPPLLTPRARWERPE